MKACLAPYKPSSSVCTARHNLLTLHWSACATRPCMQQEAIHMLTHPLHCLDAAPALTPPGLPMQAGLCSPSPALAKPPAKQLRRGYKAGQPWCAPQVAGSAAMRIPLQALNLQLAAAPAPQRIAEQQACTGQGSSRRALEVAEQLGSMSAGNSFQWGCAAAAQGVSHAALPAQPADPMTHEADSSLDGRVTQPGGFCSEALLTVSDSCLPLRRHKHPLHDTLL